MEATKKKKAYLKPEMNRFEMKMEANFMQNVSRGNVDIGESVTFECFSIKNNSWVDLGGAWNAMFKDNTGTAKVVTTISKLESHANLVYKAGFNDGDCVEVRRATEGECTDTNNSEVTIIVTLLDRGGGSCASISY